MSCIREEIHDGISFYFYEKSIRVEDMSKTLYLDRTPTQKDVEFILEAINLGRNQKTKEIHDVLKMRRMI